MRSHIKPVKCPRCSYTAAEQKDVRRHVEGAHNKWAKERWRVNDQFACEICGQLFTRKDNLQKHFRKQHLVSGSRPIDE